MIEFETTGLPRMHLFVGDASQFCDAAWKITAALPPSYETKILQGNRMRTEPGLFQEFAAALQFPYYFGSNWDALDECLSDLEWLPADGYLLFLSAAPEMLADNPGAVRVLMDILSRATEYWTTPPSPDHNEVRDRHPKPFHIIFNCGGDQVSVMRQRLSRFPHSELDLSGKAAPAAPAS